MEDGVDPGALPSIAALPQTTVRLLGSSPVLLDPSSVVKELVENALDARTHAVFVDIAANTVDSIQVKDTGHGIPQDDRQLVCRRYCTSKIRDFSELKEVGGRWLGFRGEALASMAEMSGTLEVTTRVEGEPVAVKLTYGSSGELEATASASAPIGTTVKISDLFESLPVRKQTALKHSGKWLAKIRRLMQAYALARPTVRFSLRILKAKSTKGDFVYAPKKDGSVEDAVLKAIGKDCALQCEWTALVSDGIEIRAFLPKPNATGAKIANEGSFISVDVRPVSACRGTLKQIVAICRQRLRKANPALASVREPFFCMNIACPPGSYDLNIEPAKDDVLFEDEGVVLAVVDKLLHSYYPETIVDTADEEDETQGAPHALVHFEPQAPETGLQRALSEIPITIHEAAKQSADAQSITASPRGRSRWRSNMYGIDEEDLDLLSEHQRPIIEEEEEGRYAPDVSNPWTIARMNAAMKTKKPATNGQLRTQVKASGDIAMPSSSPLNTTAPRHRVALQPLTSQTSSRMNMAQLSLDEELEESIERFLPPSLWDTHRVGREKEEQDSRSSIILPQEQSAESLVEKGPSLPSFRAGIQSTAPVRSNVDKAERVFHSQPCHSRVPQNVTPSSSPAPQRSQRGQDLRQYRPEDQWFGQPMRGEAPTKGGTRPKKNRIQDPNPSFSPPTHPSSSTQDIELANVIQSAKNKDIRLFFAQNGDKRHGDSPTGALSMPSFTPINAAAQRSSQRGPHSNDNPRATPGQLQQYSNPAGGELLGHIATDIEPDSPGIVAQLKAYTTREAPPTCPLGLDLRSTPPSHDKAPKSCRNCTPELPSLRRKSSHLHPGTHNLTLPLALRIRDIQRSIRKLDMRRNSLEWGYPGPKNHFAAFAMPVTKKTLHYWVTRITTLLDHCDGGQSRETTKSSYGDVDMHSVLEGGVKDALAASREVEVGVVSEAEEELGESQSVIETPSLCVGKWARRVAEKHGTVAAERAVSPTPAAQCHRVLDKMQASDEELVEKFADVIEEDEVLLDV